MFIHEVICTVQCSQVVGEQRGRNRKAAHPRGGKVRGLPEQLTSPVPVFVPNELDRVTFEEIAYATQEVMFVSWFCHDNDMLKLFGKVFVKAEWIGRVVGIFQILYFTGS